MGGGWRINPSIVVALALVAGGCSGTDSGSEPRDTNIGVIAVADSSDSAKHAADSSEILARVTTVTAAADGSVTASIDGIVRVTGPAGTFDPGTAVTLTTSSPQLDPLLADYVSAAGEGVDVTFPEGTGPHSALTMKFDVSAAPGPDWQPVSMHRSGDGTWVPVQATTDGAGHITVVTDAFSIHLPSWLNPLNWFNSVVSAATSFFGGRSTPDPCPPAGQAPAPQWAAFTGPITGATHVCMFENTDAAGERVEVQLRSNRGTYLVVTNPVGADYVWQAPRSRLATQVARAHFWVAADEWVIAPSDQMTYGYRRSATGGSLLVNVHANASTIEFSGLAALLGDVLGIYQFVTCFVGDPVNLTLVATSFADIVKCAITGGGELADDNKAIAAVRNLYGQSLDNATLTEQAKLLSQQASKFKGWGRILALIGVAQAIFPIWTQMLDVASELAIPGAGDINLTLEAPAAVTVAPETSAPTTSAPPAAVSDCPSPADVFAIATAPDALNPGLTYASADIDQCVPGKVVVVTLWDDTGSGWSTALLKDNNGAWKMAGLTAGLREICDIVWARYPDLDIGCGTLSGN